MNGAGSLAMTQGESWYQLPTVFLGLHDIAFLVPLRTDSEPLLTLKGSWSQEWLDAWAPEVLRSTQDQGNKTDINKKLSDELIACFPLIRHRTHRKWCIQRFIYSELLGLWTFSIVRHSIKIIEQNVSETRYVSALIKSSPHFLSIRSVQLYHNFHCILFVLFPSENP
jgi:hypothetical protein